MKKNSSAWEKLFVKQAQQSLNKYIPRIVKCLQMLKEEEIWWRPNPASNSAGNLVLHLSGSMRQWVVSGLGGTSIVRDRDKEFSERGPVARRVLVAQLRKTVREACRIVDGLSAEDLLREYTIQGFHETGLSAVARVTEHFAMHAGQIIYLTKLQRGRDLKFTHLPKVKNTKK